MPLPIIGLGLGALFSSVIEFVAKVFVKSRAIRLLTSLAVMEGMYLLLNNGVQFFLNYLFTQIGTLDIPAEICFVINGLDLVSIMSFYASVLISFAFIKYFLRMAENII